MINPLLIAAMVFGGLLLLLVIWLVVIYNRFIRTRQHIKESWADIDVELKRRYELIPNLVQTVKGYATHENETLESVIDLRNKAAANNGPAASQGADESQLMLAVSRLFAIVEAYPTLKADTNFLSLQEELANTEDRIAAARRFFNGNTREFNQLALTIPTNIVAAVFGFEPQTFFELADEAERIVPRVEL